MKRIAFLIAAVIAGVVALLAPVRPAGSGMAAQPPAPVPVTTGHAERADMPIWLAAVGTVQPLSVVTVKARVDGQLDRVMFTEGTEVHRGDILAQIDPRPFQAALASARAALAKDEAQLTNASLNVTRFEKLASIGAAPTQNLDTSHAQVAELKAATQGDRAAIDAARLILGFSTIRSPIDGRVGLRLVDPGSIVHAADPGGLVTVTQMDPIAVMFAIPQGDLALLRAGNGHPVVAVYTLEDAQKLGEGELAAIDSQIDPATGQVRLKATFPNPKRALWPGQLVTARILQRTEKDATLVPAQAVLQGQTGPYVYVVQPDATTALARPIKVGVSVQGRTQVLAGLAPDDTVVLTGQVRLVDGAKVTVAQ